MAKALLPDDLWALIQSSLPAGSLGALPGFWCAIS